MLMAIASQYMRMLQKLLSMLHVHVKKMFMEVVCFMFVLHYFYVSVFLRMVYSAIQASFT